MLGRAEDRVAGSVGDGYGFHMRTEGTKVKKSLIARDITLKLWSAENAIDASMVEVTELMNSMITGRRELGLVACVGSEALNNTGEAMTALLAAREAAVAAHRELKTVQDQLRIRPFAHPTSPIKTVGLTASDNDSQAA